MNNRHNATMAELRNPGRQAGMLLSPAFAEREQPLRNAVLA